MGGSSRACSSSIWSTPAIPPRSPSAMPRGARTKSCCLTSQRRTRGVERCSTTVARTARELFIPFTVGGGIRTPEDAAAVFDAGADKVSINSAAIAKPALIDAIGRSFGAQAVIVAIDARRATAGDSVAGAEVYIQGGRIPTGRRVLDWAREAESRGAGEILLTSMDADGTRMGFDCELTARVSASVEIPVIASGGAGTVAHFAQVFQEGKAHAALAASIFHFGVADARALKNELVKEGIPVRLPC